MRRTVYNFVAIFRSVTLRGETTRAQPWPLLLKRKYRPLLHATRATGKGIRPRAVATS